MERMICAVCQEPVDQPAGSCGRCGNLLSLPGAVRAVDPTEADAGPDAAAGPDTSVDHQAAAPRRTAADGPTCATPGCGRPALAGQPLCQPCLLDPSGRGAPRPRTFRLLTPWSEVIEIPDGTALAIGRDPTFCTFAERLAPFLYVGRTHLFLRAEAGRLLARDLGSKNGTRRNGLPLTTDVEVDLVTNDALTLGEQVTFFVVR